MKEAALPERLLARLGFAVFEDAGGGALVPVGSLPEWFGRVFGADAAKAGARFVPEERSPFLETFLMDAERVWALDSGERAESGPWIERDPEGNEVALEAEAWVLDGRRILLIGNQQERFDEVSRRLQVARNEKLAHERLRREIQTKEVLLHCIVHDLSQPLTALRGCLSLLSMNLPPEKLREVVDIADRQTRKQEGMIRDVLKAFSSEMAALQAVGAGQTVDLAQGAREVAKEYAAAFSSQGAELALDARLEEPRDWRVTGEPDRLRRMFTNFLENALRYSPAGTVVTVGAEEDGGFLRAFVDDQGPGLPEGVTAAKLFRLFGKGEESTGKAGLGLYFCKITAERWGGGVGCENRAGGGTRFWFRLPRAQGAPVAAQAAAQRPHAAEPSGGKPSRELRVLIADDIEVNRTIAAELLASRGHKVVAVDDGEPAVAAFRAQPFDVVLLDVEMNSMGGLDAARAIRKIERERGSHARILAMTAHDTAKDLEDCRQSGMDGRVVKPIDVETFFRDVEEVAAETAASQTAAPAPAAGGFQERLLARCGGDAALAAKLARIFLKDSPRLMAGVKRAVGEKDSAELASAAHALKGAVGHFGAQEAREAALRLEQMGKSGELDGVKKTLATLETEIELLCQELEVSARGRSSGKQGK
ncbi:MAG TPA: response regulator [Candidatus Solibacter sp.]|nr:response regulator [Candidatus Solibacter sp.]